MPHTCRFCSYRNGSRKVIADHELQRHPNRVQHQRKDRSRSPLRAPPHGRRLTTPDFTIRKPTRPARPGRRARKLPSLSPVPLFISPLKDPQPEPLILLDDPTPMEMEPTAPTANLPTQAATEPARPPPPIEPAVTIIQAPLPQMIMTPLPKPPASRLLDFDAIVPDPLPEPETDNTIPNPLSEVETDDIIPDPLPELTPPETSHIPTETDTLSVSCSPEEEWEEIVMANTETQTVDPEDHISRLMNRCRISIEKSDFTRPTGNSERQSFYHVLNRKESVTRVIETLHLPGGGFYTRYQYKVFKC